MILGFKEYFNELLLEAKTPEEVVRILSYKHPEIPESLIKTLVDTDPTKKKSYSNWVLSVEKDPRVIDKYLNNGKLSRIFEYFREKAKDGASLVDKASLQDAARCLPDYSDVLEPSGDPDADDFEIKFESPEWVVAVPNTYEASKKLGENTKWCTANAYGNGFDYWRNYTSAGPLWINFDKRKSETLNGATYPFKRYQFCFEKKAYLDALDQPFDWENLDMPEEVQKMYKEAGYDLTDLAMSNEERYERYCEFRWTHAYPVFEGLTLAPAWDEDMEVPNDEVDESDFEYYLYDDNDDVDPLFNSATFRYNSIVYRNEELKYAILKQDSAYSNNTIPVYTIAIRQYSTNQYMNGREIYLYPDVACYSLIGNNGSEYVTYVAHDGSVVYLTSDGTFTVNGASKFKRLFSDDTELFENRAIGQSGKLYIEAVDEGTHALFLVDHNDLELIPIIENDIPENGKFFQLNEEGMIVGKYGTYSPTGKYDSDEELHYKPVSTLANKTLIVARSQYSTYNVFRGDDLSNPIFENDFDEFVFDLTDTNYNAIIVQTDYKMKQLWSIAQRKPVSEMYDFMQSNKNKDIIIAANGNGNGSIGEERYLITGKGDIQVASAYPFCKNNRTPVYINTENGTRFSVFDFAKMEFDKNCDWIRRASTLGYYSLGSERGRYVLAEDNDGEIHLFDWYTDRTLASGIDSSRKPKALSDSAGRGTVNESMYLLKFNDSTCNVFDVRTGEFVTQENAREILGSKSFSTNDVFLMLNYGEKNYFVGIAEGQKPRKLLGGNPVLSAGHQLCPTMNGQKVMFTIDGKRENLFALDLFSGKISFYGVDPQTLHYDEMPVEQAPPEKQQLAATIFSWLAKQGRPQTLGQRMNEIRKL